MPAIWNQPLGPEAADGILIMLPGLGDRPPDFVTRGMFDAVRQHLPTMDIVRADAHFGYYSERSILERLREDIVQPARDAGYREIWMLGVSMGGLGSTIYASTFQGEIDGIVMFAPFLGEGVVAESVRDAPSLAAWDPREVSIENDFDLLQAQLWGWLQEQVGPEGTCELFLAYGDKDGPGTEDERLAEALPADRFVVHPGGHHWNVWMSLAHELLPRVAQRVGGAAADPVR